MEIRRTSDSSLISLINGNTKTFTLSEDTNAYILARVTAGRPYTNDKAYLQMELGESATTWESTANTATDLTARADITRNTADITRNTADITRNTADILYIKGETGTFETESVSQMYNGNSELKTETNILKFYKAEIPAGLSEIVFAQENAGTNYSHWYNEYDENDNLIYAVTLTLSNVTDTITLHNPDTVSYIKISMWTGNGALTLGYNVPSLIDEKISERMGTNQYSHVSALGDSITNGLYYFNNAQAYTDNTYQKLLADHFGASFQKLGVNSTSISTQSNYESSANAFVNRYTQIAENADLIIVAGGTNDWGHNTPMGTIADTTDVGFYGALDVLINGLITHYPNARIIFVTPFQRNYSSGVYDPDTNQNGQGLTLKDYCDAIRQKCTQYGLQCVDGYAESGINKTAVCKTNFAPDGLHPNPNGHAKIYANLLHALV